MEYRVFVLVLCMFIGTFGKIEYKCFPNGNIVFTNPDPAFFGHVNITYLSGRCNHSFADDISVLILHDCTNADTEVILTFYNSTLLTKGTVNGPTRYVCNDIPHEGVLHNVQIQLPDKKTENLESAVVSVTQTLQKHDPQIETYLQSANIAYSPRTFLPILMVVLKIVFR